MNYKLPIVKVDDILKFAHAGKYEGKVNDTYLNEPEQCYARLLYVIDMVLAYDRKKTSTNNRNEAERRVLLEYRASEFLEKYKEVVKGINQLNIGESKTINFSEKHYCAQPHFAYILQYILLLNGAKINTPDSIEIFNAKHSKALNSDIEIIKTGTILNEKDLKKSFERKGFYGKSLIEKKYNLHINTLEK